MLDNKKAYISISWWMSAHAKFKTCAVHANALEFLNWATNVRICLFLSIQICERIADKYVSFYIHHSLLCQLIECELAWLPQEDGNLVSINVKLVGLYKWRDGVYQCHLMH